VKSFGKIEDILFLFLSGKNQIEGKGGREKVWKLFAEQKAIVI
jgi:hypothetical protein